MIPNHHHRSKRISGKAWRGFSLIELLVVIAMMAILPRTKWLFFLLISAIFAFSRFDGKTINTQIPNVTFCLIP